MRELETLVTALRKCYWRSFSRPLRSGSGSNCGRAPARGELGGAEIRPQRGRKRGCPSGSGHGHRVSGTDAPAWEQVCGGETVVHEASGDPSPGNTVNRVEGGQRRCAGSRRRIWRRDSGVDETISADRKTGLRIIRVDAPASDQDHGGGKIVEVRLFPREVDMPRASFRGRGEQSGGLRRRCVSSGPGLRWRNVDGGDRQRGYLRGGCWWSKRCQR